VALTERKLRFIELHTTGPTAGNGSASVRAAGYNPKDDNSAASMASQLLAEAEVRDYRNLPLLARRAAAVKHLEP